MSIAEAATLVESHRTSYRFTNWWEVCRPLCTLVNDDGTPKTQAELNETANTLGDELRRLSAEFKAANQTAQEAQEATSENYRKKYGIPTFWASLSFEERLAFSSKEATDKVRLEHYSRLAEDVYKRHSSVSIRAVTALAVAEDFLSSTTCAGIARRCMSHIELVRDLLAGLVAAREQWNQVATYDVLGHIARTLTTDVAIFDVCALLELVIPKLVDGTATDLECVQWINALHSIIHFYQVEFSLANRTQSRDMRVCKSSLFVHMDMSYAVADRKLHLLVDKINTGASWQFAFRRPCDPPQAVQVRKDRIALLQARVDAYTKSMQLMQSSSSSSS